MSFQLSQLVLEGLVEILDSGNGGLLIPIEDAYIVQVKKYAKLYYLTLKLIEKKKQYSINYIE